MKKTNLFYLLMTLLVVTFSSCDKKKDDSLPKFSISPEAHTFNEIELGQQVDKEFVITNKGDAELNLKSFTFVGDSKEEFSTTAQNNTTLNVGEKYNFNVVFKANQEGDKSVELKIETNDGEHKLLLNAKALPLPSAIEFVYVEGGTLELGNPRKEETGYHRDHPIHPVTISSFSISKYEITNEQYVYFLNKNEVKPDGTLNGKKYITIYGRSKVVDSSPDGKVDGKYNCISYEDGRFLYKKGTGNYPASWITWEGANAFAKWKGGRLPTEAEWEYAARGGQKSHAYDFSGSSNADEVAWYGENSENPDFNAYETGLGLHPVGQKKPNELGIYDMTGNVWEWCNDWYSEENISTPEKNPQGPASGTYHTLRGGDYQNDIEYTYVFYRFGRDVYSADSYLITGFRMVKDMSPIPNI